MGKVHEASGFRAVPAVRSSRESRWRLLGFGMSNELPLVQSRSIGRWRVHAIQADRKASSVGARLTSDSAIRSLYSSRVTGFAAPSTIVRMAIPAIEGCRIGPLAESA